jgi:hypothetical protein
MCCKIIKNIITYYFKKNYTTTCKKYKHLFLVLKFYPDVDNK